MQSTTISQPLLALAPCFPDGPMLSDGVIRVDLTLPQGAELEFGRASTEPLQCFVAGPENRLPILALEDLLLGEGSLTASGWTSPLVLTGPMDTGKSLLVRAIVRRWRTLLGEDAVGYFSAIDFARQLSEARLDNRDSDFWRPFASHQILVLEDLDHLPTKPFVQLSLRSLLDDCQLRGVTVLCTARRVPQALANLEPGLRDRLAAGLLLCLNPPGAAARCELLRLAAAQRQLEIEERQLCTLAESVPGSAPEVLRALREWELTRAEVNGFSEHRNRTRSGLDPKNVIAIVARYFGITQSALRGPARRKSLVLARSVTVYLLRTHSGTSYADIGKALGNRDHTTIMHAKQAIEKRMSEDRSLQDVVSELQRIVLAV